MLHRLAGTIQSCNFPSRLARGIEPEAAPNAKGLLIHPDIARFDIDCRSYSVRTDRFEITTLAAPWVTILDITTKIFAEHLLFTPIKAFGINRRVHFGLPCTSARTKLGRVLAPIEPWGKYDQGMESNDTAFVGGLQSLVMKRKSSLDEHSLETNVTVEPSVRITDNTGVYMEVNCHHRLSGLPDGHGSEQAMALLSKRFESAAEEANSIIGTIMKMGNDQ